MPEVLHESQGLRIHRNDNNSFIIARLHYTADPAKRSPQWKQEAAAGMTPEKFAREYDIDYTAVLGSKVFPELTSIKHKVIINHPYPDFGPQARYWGGLDYGTRNPASFHVYTIVDGVIYTVFELYEPCKNIPDFVQKMQEFPYWKQIRWIAADPSLWTPTQQQAAGNLLSVQDLFYREGVKSLLRGRNDGPAEEAWVAMVHKHWNSEDVTFKIFDTCPNLIQELENTIYVSQSERQLTTTVYNEKIANVNNHALDDCKYFMLSQPPQQAPTIWKQTRMVERWAQPGQFRPDGGPARQDRGYSIPSRS